jgi:phytanoyl-CoA hydroxylase
MTEERPLTQEEAAECRSKAKQVLADLNQAIFDDDFMSTESWVRGNKAHISWLNDRSIQCQHFDAHGFIVVKDFANSDDVKALKDQMASLVNENWDPFTKDKEDIDTFGTDAAANTARGDYFLDSSNRVHYFAEPRALDEDFVDKRGKLSILNKAGHGMHNIAGAFRDYTLSDKMRNLGKADDIIRCITFLSLPTVFFFLVNRSLFLVLDLGWKDPVVPQSMYIFKQAKIGGE